MRVVSFINLKGGVGKTVSAVNFAHILAVVPKKRGLLGGGGKQGNAPPDFPVYGGQGGTAGMDVFARS